MLFLVTGQNIDPGYLLPPEQNFATVEHAVVPSFQILGQMAKEGRLKGGVFAGERGGAFVVDAASLEEMDGLLNQLPFFGLIKWEVKALVPFDTMAQNIPKYIQQARQMMQQGPH